MSKLRIGQIIVTACCLAVMVLLDYSGLPNVIPLEECFLGVIILTWWVFGE